MINIKLKKGDILPIYTDFQERVGYEGKAILLEKIDSYDKFGRLMMGESFFINEKLLPEEKKEYTIKEYKMIDRYQTLDRYFNGREGRRPYKLYRRLHNILRRLRSIQIDEYNEMYARLDKFRKQYAGTDMRLDLLLNEYNNDYIVRYMQQNANNWTNSTWTSERWKVRFIEDHVGWESDFVTNRRIRKITCNRPNNSVKGKYRIGKYTTHNGILRGNDQVYEVENKKPEKELQFKSDDEFEELVKSKLSERRN